MMERQVDQLVRLIDDLLDVSRITRGHIPLQKARMRLADAVRLATDTSRPHIDAHGHTLVVELPSVPLDVEGDVARLSQVFANLLNNAARYTDRGGRIRLTLERDDHDAVVRVEDNGIGIPGSMLGRVFDMFTQSTAGCRVRKAASGLACTSPSGSSSCTAAPSPSQATGLATGRHSSSASWQWRPTRHRPHNDRHIAVVLSGLLTDGALRLRAVKRAGGTVIAQRPMDAPYPDMPSAAIDPGCVDGVVPAGQLAKTLVDTVVPPDSVLDSHKWISPFSCHTH